MDETRKLRPTINSKSHTETTGMAGERGTTKRINSGTDTSGSGMELGSGWMALSRMEITTGSILGTVVMMKIQQTMDSRTHKKLWDITWDLWDHHNEALHNSMTYQHNIMDSHINEHVQHLYSQGLQAIP